MADENEAETGPEGIGARVDPAAEEMALASASRGEADAFLRAQRGLIEDQRHHLHEQLKQLSLGLWEKRIGMMLRLAMLAVGLGVIIGLGMAVWNAAHADGLVIEGLSVPPRFAQAGISGEVLADDLMNRVADVRAIGVGYSLDDSKAVSRDRDEEVKVEIPETGVSLGLAWHYLRLWLGHERRLTGNLRDTGDGAIALTVTLEGEPAITYGGKELDRLEQQAAEHVFRTIDPLNYSLYLMVKGRFAEAMAVTESAAAAASDPMDKGEAYSLLSWETEHATGDMALADARSRLAISIYPKGAAPHVEIIRDSIVLGHDEEGLAVARAIPNFRAEDQPAVQRGFGFQAILYEAERERDLETGDFAAAQANKCVIRCPLPVQAMLNAGYAARAHDVASSRTLMETARAAGLTANAQIGEISYFRDAAMGDWQAAVTDARDYITALKADKSVSPILSALVAKNFATSLLARALAESGDVAGAWAAIGATPGDCYDCIRTRGLIAAVAKDWGRADYWFARAVQAAPSVPFAYEDWGRSLLARGQPDAAIEQFKRANQKGPHFTDALEGWGEALMARNQSHLAVAKFEEANKYAPSWGRLHLKWGEALLYAGKRDEAKAEFTRAGTLDLTSSEKAELAGMSHG
jgi:hypothetical protein